MPEDKAPQTAARTAFATKVAIALALTGLALLLVYLANIILLIVAAIIVAALLHAFAKGIARVVPLREDWAVIPALLIILAVLAIGLTLFGRQMAEQVAILIGRLPQDWSQVRAMVQSLPFGDALSKEMQHAGEFAANYVGQVPLIAIGVAGAVANFGLAIVGGVMLAMEPRYYRDGLVQLAPHPMRPNLTRALNSTGRALKGWLFAQLISMVIIGILTGTGLWLVGVPSALGLGLFAGLAQFVPVLGPIVSAVPGLLVAATSGWTVLIWAAVVYVGVQQTEGNLVTPWVQKHFAGIPMALALFSIVAFGALFGVLGVILATPLALIALVLVRCLYIRDILGDPIELPGEHKPEGPKTTS